MNQIDTPPWTLSGWLWGLVGLFSAMLYLMGWYFLFASPLILVFLAIATVVSFFAVNFDSAFAASAPRSALDV